MIRFIDLFAGIGGIRRGVVNALESYGIDSQCVLSSEHNVFSQVRLMRKPVKHTN